MKTSPPSRGFPEHRAAGETTCLGAIRGPPRVFFFHGITAAGTDPARAAPNHSPRFFVDESALVVGVRALAYVAVDYLERR